MAFLYATCSMERRLDRKLPSKLNMQLPTPYALLSPSRRWAAAIVANVAKLSLFQHTWLRPGIRVWYNVCCIVQLSSLGNGVATIHTELSTSNVARGLAE